MSFSTDALLPPQITAQMHTPESHAATEAAFNDTIRASVEPRDDAFRRAFHHVQTIQHRFARDTTTTLAKSILADPGAWREVIMHADHLLRDAPDSAIVRMNLADLSRLAVQALHQMLRSLRNRPAELAAPLVWSVTSAITIPGQSSLASHSLDDLRALMFGHYRAALEASSRYNDAVADWYAGHLCGNHLNLMTTHLMSVLVSRHCQARNQYDPAPAPADALMVFAALRRHATPHLTLSEVDLVIELANRLLSIRPRYSDHAVEQYINLVQAYLLLGRDDLVEGSLSRARATIEPNSPLANHLRVLGRLHRLV